MLLTIKAQQRSKQNNYCPLLRSLAKNRRRLANYLTMPNLFGDNNNPQGHSFQGLFGQTQSSGGIFGQSQTSQGLFGHTFHGSDTQGRLPPEPSHVATNSLLREQLEEVSRKLE